MNKEDKVKKYTLYAYIISKIKDVTEKKLEEINAIELFKNIDMPTVEVLAEMQWNGMYLDVDELNKYGNQLKERLEILTKEIYELCGEDGTADAGSCHALSGGRNSVRRICSESIHGIR